MPTELRHVLFRHGEVTLAVKEYHRRTKTPFPPGNVVQCDVERGEAGGPVRFRMVLALDPAGGLSPKHGESVRHEVIVEGPTLAAALILFCHDKRIPLPASGGKSLQCFGDQLGLVVTVNPKQDELPPIGRLAR